MTLEQTIEQPTPAQLRALLHTGPSPQAIAALMPGQAGRALIERVHFPGSKPVQLQIRTQDPAGGSRLLLGEWVGSTAADVAQAEVARLAKPRRGQAAAVHPVVADPAHGLVLRRPGFDARLPGLRLLHDPVLAARTFGPEAQVSLVSHRLGKRAVLRVCGPGGLRYARLRPVTSASGQEAYDRHLALWSALQGQSNLSIPRPVRFDPDLGMAVFEALPGAPPVFAGPPGFAACAAVMQAMAALHGLSPAAPPHEAADEMALLSAWTARVEPVFPRLAASVRPLLDRLGDRLTRLAPVPKVLCHRDLHEGQILLHADRAGWLDFDTLRSGDPALDLGNLQAHLILAGLRDGRPRDAFVTALENAAPAPLARVALWRRAALLRLAMIYAFSAEPPRVIRGLLARAA